MTQTTAPFAKCHRCGAVLPKSDGKPVYWLAIVMQESGIPLSVPLCEQCAPPRPGKVRRIIEERSNG